MSIPLLPGYSRDQGAHRGQFAKSHIFETQQAGAAQIRRDVRVDAREYVAPSSFNGTGQLQHVGQSIVRGASMISQHSAAQSYSNSGRLEQPVENAFASPNRVASLAKHAHLRRAPVASDYASAGEPLPHLLADEVPRLPAFVEYDNKVLRFSGYFSEATHNNASGDRFRVRPILLYFFLVDDSIQIVEPPTANSGLPQGVLVKRHLVPKDERGATFVVEDLFVGAQLPIYGRVFRLTDADPFTRAFYEKNGKPLEIAEDTPLDPFARRSTSTEINPALRRKTADEHAEAKLGKRIHGPAGIAATQKFLQLDGQILRFYAVYNDTKLFGEKRPYVLHVFLADDTCEVCEVPQPNSGHGNFPFLVKRCRLPKDHTQVQADVAHLGSNTDNKRAGQEGIQCYTAADFRIGGTFNVYGRELLILGCDAFTKAYYQKTYGMPDEDFEQIAMLDAPEEPLKIEVPPYNGFGSDEDSLGSFLFLMPKQPKTDQKKLFEMEGILLRFACAFKNPGPHDRERKFILTYYTSNDQLQLFELAERNTGHIAGKFLDRQRLRNLQTGEWFSSADLFIGATIEISKHEFILLDADEYTRKFQERNPHIWSAAKGNLNNEAKALQHTGGRKFDTHISNAANTLPNRRPF